MNPTLRAQAMNSTVHTLHRPKLLPTIREMSEQEIADEINARWLEKMSLLAAAAEERGLRDGFATGWYSGAAIGASFTLLAGTCIYALHVTGCL